MVYDINTFHTGITFREVTDFIKTLYDTGNFIPLHAPCFSGNEKKYLNECIESTFVSSVGKFVNELEAKIAAYTGAEYAIATVNGTAALHTALLLAGVQENDEVLTQPLTFIATANAIHYAGGVPVFIDVEQDTLGMSPHSLRTFLEEKTINKNGKLVNSMTGRIIKACVPVHTFGLPCKIDSIQKICKEYGITLIEDAAEALGSFYREKHTGTFGTFGIFSFNGNKTITAGGGGVIITDNKMLAQQAKHITTTAKKEHKWAYDHDRIGYNYRMPNINAALACAQLEQLSHFINKKRALAASYHAYFSENDICCAREIEHAKANYWLNTILLDNKQERDAFLRYSNDVGIMTRPAWRLLNKLKMYSGCFTGNLENAEWLEDRIINIPSSVKL